MRVLLFVLCVLLGASVPPATAADLLSLWTPAQLRGTPDERKASALGPVDAKGPDQPRPSRAQPPEPTPAQAVRRAQTQAKLVALTFDLCELSDQRAGYDGEVVDALRDFGARATFFASGKWMASHFERALQLLADPRFEMGNHAWTHGNFGVLSLARATDQIQFTQRQYELVRAELARRAEKAGLGALVRQVPESLRCFRPPYGRCRPDTLNLVAGLGLLTVTWDVNTADAGAASAQVVAERILKGVKPGSIVLMHGNGFGKHTGEALRAALPRLAAQGYRFVTVSELLAQGRPETASDCYADAPGDTARYDAVFGEGTTHPPKKAR